MERIAFYGGAALVMFGLLFLVFSRREPRGEHRFEFGPFKLRSRTPAFVVMAFGLVLMWISPRFPVPMSYAREPQVITKDGGMVDYGCGSHAVSTVEYSAPAGYKIVSAQPDTKDVVSTKTATPKITSKDERHVAAQADFDGKDKDTLGLNCPGGGHGRVSLRIEIQPE
ncbi:hypothetical protein JQ614_08245 [Bradyrhizobium diazoefficiens]|uniref:hypothetical protein n=1 Tax=Bradyrhizobium diazoefficiens TaxID=1355477 RepID=UPI001B8B005D|nr:hypothetical protein [Bradyrhizobium diazoefficiens]MBR0861897.1 hypothetical protein [Bradyrhizobium diazoefficiens]MBR0886315.1 hypothetical protein [Bradyrhizobium diazoefficiens]MBR0918125.1 hypothetical protein [Bradyrhizobium diazoefficiens]